MKHSKKGISLVELIICCAIIVMIGGACTAVIASGSTIFNTSAQTASSQMDADILQTYMMNFLPSASNLKVVASGEDPNNFTKGIYLFFDKNTDYFTIRLNNENTTISSIEQFTYSIVKAGDSDSETARPQFVFSAKLINGKVMSGGFVLSNICYSDEMSSIVDIDASEHPFCFNYTE